MQTITVTLTLINRLEKLLRAVIQLLSVDAATTTYIAYKTLFLGEYIYIVDTFLIMF